MISITSNHDTSPAFQKSHPWHGARLGTALHRRFSPRFFSEGRRQLSKAISERIHWFRVDGRPILIKKYVVSKISGFMWTGPELQPFCTAPRFMLLERGKERRIRMSIFQKHKIPDETTRT